MGRQNLVFPYPDDHFLDPGIPKGVLSPSGFNSYRRCPRQYMYSYVLGLRMPPKVVMIKGTAIHKGAEVVHKHTIEKKSLMSREESLQAVADSFDEEKEEVEDWSETDEGTAKDEAIYSFEAYYHQAIPYINPIAAEEPFALRIGGVPIRGVIDLIDSVEDQWSIVEEGEEKPRIQVVADLKTTKKKWPLQKIEKEPQLTFYALAKDTAHTRVDFVIAGKKGVTYVPVSAERDALEKRILTEDVIDVADNIKAGRFPRCDPTTWACTPSFCGYYDMCRGSANTSKRGCLKKG